LIAKILSSLLIILIIALQYRVWHSENGTQKIDHLVIKIELQEKQNESLSEQIESLKKEIVLLRNQPEVLEEKAREQLGLVKKDEVFYRIIPAE